jgi:hypothetical protein
MPPSAWAAHTSICLEHPCFTYVRSATRDVQRFLLVPCTRTIFGTTVPIEEAWGSVGPRSGRVTRHSYLDPARARAARRAVVGSSRETPLTSVGVSLQSKLTYSVLGEMGLRGGGLDGMLCGHNRANPFFGGANRAPPSGGNAVRTPSTPARARHPPQAMRSNCFK